MTAAGSVGRIARIAAGGIRLAIDELRTDVTKTRKDGSRGRLRLDYGEHRDPQAALAALAWLWKFILCRAALDLGQDAQQYPASTASAGAAVTSCIRAFRRRRRGF